MKISIITTAYNSAETIKDTLDSILSQTYPYIELIIVDGASKDNTMEIVKSYEEKFNGRMRYISERDTGIYNAMNKGLKMASGDVIGILNSDDVFVDETIIQKYVDAFNRYDVDTIAANVKKVDSKDLNKLVSTRRVGDYKKGAFLRGWHPAHPAFYVKKEVYEKYGYFHEDLKIAADYELMLRFIEKNDVSVKYINMFAVKLRVGGASTTFKGHINSNIEVIKAMKRNGYKYPLLCLPRKIFPKILRRILRK